MPTATATANSLDGGEAAPDGPRLAMRWIATLLIAVSSLSAAQERDVAREPGPPGTAREGAPARMAREDVPPEVDFRVGGGHTDNLFRDSTEVRSDIRTAGMGFRAELNGRRLEGDVATDVEFRQYATDAIADDDEVLGSADGELLVHAVPERLTWTFGQSFGQTRTDPLSPAGPDNRERTRVFFTGPQLNVPIGGRNEIEIGGRVFKRDFEDSDYIDSRLTTARFAFSHAIDRVTRLDVAVDRSSNELDGGEDTYDFGIFSVTYARRFSSGGVELSLGKGRVELADHSESTAVGRFEWSREVGARSRVGLWVRHELTDAGEVFRAAGMLGIQGDALSGFTTVTDINDDRLRGVVLTPDPLRRSSAGTIIDLIGERTSLGIRVAFAQDDFETSSAFDNDFESFEISLARELGLRWSALARIFVGRQNFEVLGLDNEDLAGAVVVTRRIRRQLRLDFAYERSRRDGGFDRYEENVYLVSLGYRL